MNLAHLEEKNSLNLAQPEEKNTISKLDLVSKFFKPPPIIIY